MTRSHTVRGALARGLTNAVFICGGLAGGLLGTMFVLQHFAHEPVVDVPVIRPLTSPAEEEMLHDVKRGKCWQGDDHPDVIPGHAWFALEGQRLHYGPSKPAFDIAFGPDGRMATGDESPGTVRAFCL